MYLLAIFITFLGSGSTTSLLQPRGGALNFFQVGVCGPDFRSVGLANWHLPLKRGLVSWKFPIWGLVSWKFPNFGGCELKFGWKLRLFRLKFPNFLKRGSCELTLLLEMRPLRAAREAWKGGLQGRTSPYPLSRSVPLGTSTSAVQPIQTTCIVHQYYNTVSYTSFLFIVDITSSIHFTCRPYMKLATLLHWH